MKKLFILFSISVFVSCSATKGIDPVKDNNKDKEITTGGTFRIKKIKNKKSFYIIYAERNDSIFKIVSDMDSLRSSCTSIKAGKSYPLVLKCTFPLDTLMGQYIAPNLGVVGLVTEQGDIIKIEKKSHNKIYIATNLKGLCIN